jgi:peptidoglycan/LPS O-acetylase OafA/YrhL
VPDKRNHFIDLLRIVAASWVALFHFNQPIPNIDNWYRGFCKFGYVGVPIFFVVSGYCILIALGHGAQPFKFAIRRFFRIFPPYWFSLLLIVIIIAGEKLITGTNSVAFPKNITGILATIALLTNPLTNVPTVNWVYWTLPYEVMFYLVVFITTFFNRKYLPVIFIVITLLTFLLPPMVGGALSFFKYWPMFMLGVCVYYLVHGLQPKLTIALTILTIINILFCGLGLSYVITALIIAALIYLNHLRPMKQNLFSKYGDVSYSLYLIHVPVGEYVLGRLKAGFQTNIFTNIIYDVLLLVLCIILSSLMFKYVELPAIKYGKRIAG